MKEKQLNPTREHKNRTLHEFKLKTPNRKKLKHVYEFRMTCRWNEKMKKRRTYEDGELGWWSRHLECEGSKISEQLPPLERTKAPKIRQGRGEDKVLTQFSLNLSRVSL